MASTAIIGLPGGGKSYFAVERLLESLKSDGRNIVTNIPLNLPAVADFCAKKYGDYAAVDRITLLDPLDFGKAKNFFLHRGGDLTIEKFPESFDEYSDGQAVDAELVRQSFGPGVVYFLDEVHQFLNARNWKDVGPSVLRYLSMHRHLGDDIYWITQAPGNVDKQWRSLTQSYFNCRNYKFEKFRGMSKGSELEVRETLNIPSPHATEIAQSVRTRKIQKDVAACYSTSVMQGDADTKQKFGGISYKWLIVAAFVVLIGGAFGISALAKYGFRHVSNAFGRKPTTASSAPAVPVPLPAVPAATLATHQGLPPVEIDVKPITRQDGIAPPGFVPAVASRTLLLPCNSDLANSFGILPPQPSPYPVTAWGLIGGKRVCMIAGQMRSEGSMLPDGSILLTVSPYGGPHPTSRDAYGRYFFHPPSAEVWVAPAVPQSIESPDKNAKNKGDLKPSVPREIPGMPPLDSTVGK